MTMTATSEAIALQPPPLHEGQRAALSSTARFIVLICGRRWGKSKGGSLWLLDGAMGPGAGIGTVCQWVAPTYGTAKYGWRELVRLGRQIPGCRMWSEDVANSNSRMLLPNGAEIVLGSTDHPDSLRGEGVTRLVVDEAAMVPPSAWTERMYPSLTDRAGRALLISTPKGPNWLQKRYLRGQDPDEPIYDSYRYPSASNPYLNPAVIEEARDELPDMVFRQEYLAEFIADGAVFRGLDDCTRAVEPTGRIVIGVDWAQSEDFSVFTAVDCGTGAVVDIRRLNQVGYDHQVSELVAFTRQHKATLVLAEDNGPGAAPCDYAAREGIPIERFTTTQSSKAEIISNLIAAFDHREIILPPYDEGAPDGYLWEVQRTELQAYTMTRTKGGNFRYSAPEGMHDDCVMSLAIAWEARQRGGVSMELL